MAAEEEDNKSRPHRLEDESIVEWPVEIFCPNKA
jgi:hypothetical protein